MDINRTAHYQSLTNIVDQYLGNRREMLDDQNAFQDRIIELRETYQKLKMALKPSVVSRLETLRNNDPELYEYIEALENHHIQFFCSNCNSFMVRHVELPICAKGYMKLNERLQNIQNRYGLTDEEMVKEMNSIFKSKKIEVKDSKITMDLAQSATELEQPERKASTKSGPQVAAPQNVSPHRRTTKTFGETMMDSMDFLNDDMKSFGEKHDDEGRQSDSKNEDEYNKMYKELAMKFGDLSTHGANDEDNDVLSEAGGFGLFMRNF